MDNDTREPGRDSIQVLMPWGLPLPEMRHDFVEAAAWWLSGAVSLLAWTAIAVLLTST